MQESALRTRSQGGVGRNRADGQHGLVYSLVLVSYGMYVPGRDRGRLPNPGMLGGVYSRMYTTRVYRAGIGQETPLCAEDFSPTCRTVSDTHFLAGFPIKHPGKCTLLMIDLLHD